MFAALHSTSVLALDAIPVPALDPAAKVQESACGKDPEKTLDPLSEPRIVMKHDALMYVLDETGMIPGGNNSAYGLYRDDTRTLSKLRYVLNGQAPELLSKDVKGYSGTFIYGIRQRKKDADRSIVLRREVAMYQGIERASYSYEFFLLKNQMWLFQFAQMQISKTCLRSEVSNRKKNPDLLILQSVPTFDTLIQPMRLTQS